MKFNDAKISEYLRYGFLEESCINDNEIGWIKYEQYNIRSNIERVILDNFYCTWEEIWRFSEMTKKEIVLALSWWIDSLLIFKVLQEIGLDFTAINIEYEWNYSEKEQVLKNIGNFKNIKFINNKLNDYNCIDDVLYPNIVSHPTIFAYKDIVDNLYENSILITWDLWDEIFWFTESWLTAWENIPEYIFTEEQLLHLFNWKEIKSKKIVVDKEQFNTEIFLFYKMVTYKMWKNVLKWKNIEYYPFYKNFIPFARSIRSNWLSTENKDFLYYNWSKFWLLKDNMVSSWIKYPVDNKIINKYLSYIVSKNDSFIQNWIEINFGYLKKLITLETPKKVKWKLFSLILLINYLEKNDSRFC